MTMSSGFTITCINKNANGEIIRLGGAGWSLDIREVVARLVGERLRLTILLDNEYYEIRVQGEGSNAYLVVAPHQTPLHDIEDIPSC